MKRLLLLVLIIFTLCVTEFVLSFTTTRAMVMNPADGDLYPTFGSGGKVTTDLLGNTEEGYDVAGFNDGKFVVAGVAFNPSTGNSDFAVVRYNRDGTLDTTFDGDGKVTTDFFGGDDSARAVGIDFSTNKIVVAGTATNPSTGLTDFALVRYNPDGSLDTTFDADGKLTIDFFGGADHALDIAVEKSSIGGKIFVTGDAYNPGNGTTDFAVARLVSSDGSLDAGFAGTGKTTTDFLAGDDYGRGVALELVGSDRFVIVAGYARNPSTGEDDFALAKYRPDGGLDMTFGGDGRVTTDFSGQDDHGQTIVPGVGGTGFVVAGDSKSSSLSGSQDFALAAYNRDGTLNETFNGNGKVVTDFFSGSDSANAAFYVPYEPEPKIVVAGQARNPASGKDDFALARYKLNGSLDTEFGNNGRVITDFSGGDDQARSAYLDPGVLGQAGATIVVAGVSRSLDGANADFAVARYFNDPDPIVEVSISGGPAANGQEGENVTVTVVLVEPTTRTVSVDFGTMDGGSYFGGPNYPPANAGTDYDAVSGTLTFSPGETEKTITVTLKTDGLVEGPENFTVFLSNPANAFLEPSSSSIVVTITDPPPAPWTAKDFAKGTDGKTRLLWTDANGKVDFWTIRTDGAVESKRTYGPFPGWSARQIAVGVDAKTYLLWTNQDGQFVVSVIAADGTPISGHSYGPIAGWTARDIGVGADNKPRLLLTNVNGQAVLLVTAAATGTPEAGYPYGPFTGWTAERFAVSSDNKMRLMWTNTDGRARVWVVPATGGNATFTQELGPFAGWTAVSIATGADKKLRMLWANTDGSTALVMFNATLIFEFTKVYEPSPGWSAKSVTAGAAGRSELLLTHTDGRAVIVTVAADGTAESARLYFPI